MEKKDLFGFPMVSGEAEMREKSPVKWFFVNLVAGTIAFLIVAMFIVFMYWVVTHTGSILKP
jgi:hypothetical protein